MLFLIDQITAGFLSALETGGQRLAVFALPILGVCAVIGLDHCAGHFRPLRIIA